MEAHEKAVDWNVVAAIRASSRRQKVISQLLEGPKFAAEIGDTIDYSQVTVSKNFRWLKRQNPPLLKCLTPDRPHHVICALTAEGRKVAERV